MKAILQPQEVNNLDEIQNLISLGEGKLTKEKQAVIVIGDTGEGKSTLINYIAQNKLYAEKKGYPAKYIVNADNQLGDIKIGNTSVSETTIPNKWIDKDGVAYWDCPGFGDTKGVVQDVANAFYIKKLFDNIENIKVVVVVSEDTIGGSRADKFLNLLKKLGNLFVNLDSLKDSLSLVITKASISDVTAFKKFLSEELIPQQTEYLNQKQKSLLEFFASTKSKIGFFESPKSAGEIDLSNSVQIKQVISNAEYLNKPAINITVSNQSLLELEVIAKDINEQIKDICKDINQDLRILSRKIVDNGDTSQEVKAKLIEILSYTKLLKVDNKQDFVLNYKKLVNQLTIVDRSEQLSKSIELLDFISIVKKDIKYETADWGDQLKAIELINKLIENPEVKYIDQDQSLHIKATVVGISEVMDKIRANSDKEIKSVNVFSYDTLYLDEDLVNKGKNTSIIAPKWKVKNDIKIDLSGITGSNHINTKADDVSGQNHNGSGKIGNDGLPGLPGGSSGSFYGSAKHITNVNKLSINVNGGNGGAGQHGSNGTNGQSGDIGALAAVSNRDPSFLVARKKVTFTEKDGIGKTAHVIKTLGTFNDQMLEIYKAKGEAGKKGGDSGAGGAGGIGGFSGKIILNETLDNKITVNNNDGNTGTDGIAGQPGKGGKNGVTYYGEYLNEMLFPVFREKGKEFDETTIINGGGNVLVQTSTALIVNQCAEELVTGVGLKCVTEGGKNFTVKLGEQAIEKALEQTVKQGTKEMIKGSTWFVAEQAGKEVLEEVSVQVLKQGSKEITKTVSKEAMVETMKNVALEGSKKVGQEIIKDGSGVVVKEAIVTGSKGFWGTAGGFAASMGTSLLIQGGLSVVSAYGSSGWTEGPKALDDTGYANDGLKPSQPNKKDQRHPSESSVISDLEVEILISCFNDYNNNFIQLIGNEAELWLSE